jgi:Zn ribbon nucleic-acid-binding protein
MQQQCPCPNCKRVDGAHLPEASKYAHVEYFRCNTCGHVWQVPKPGTGGEARNVTQPRKRS